MQAPPVDIEFTGSSEADFEPGPPQQIDENMFEQVGPDEQVEIVTTATIEVLLQPELAVADYEAEEVGVDDVLTSTEEVSKNQTFVNRSFKIIF